MAFHSNTYNRDGGTRYHPPGFCPKYAAQDDVFVPDAIRKCVVFIGSMEMGRFRPRATGFLARVDGPDNAFIYLVTAEHVIAGFRKKNWPIYCRMNLQRAGATQFLLDSSNWWSHPDSKNLTDVAVTPITFPNEPVEIVDLPLTGSYAEHSQAVPTWAIGLGDETFAVGLFRSHYGYKRNIPIVRTGNIAALPDEPVHSKWCGDTSAFLIEMRSIAGLSGSPVFVNLGPSIYGRNNQIIDWSMFPLVGLISGHFEFPNAKEDAVVADDDDSNLSVNRGVAIVIPTRKIMETLNQEELVEMRKMRDREHRDSYGATLDAVLEPDHSTTDENPNHKEDFTALLNAASKKKRQADQT